MRTTVVLLLLFLAATVIVCRSLEENEDAKDASWTDWAKDKVTRVFMSHQVKGAAPNIAPNQAGDAPSGTPDDISERAIEAEEEAAEAAKKLSGET